MRRTPAERSRRWLTATPRSSQEVGDRGADDTGAADDHVAEECHSAYATRPKEVFMHYGVVMFPTEYAMAPDELARALEERGFESVWFPEHTHIPASRRKPLAGRRELPRRLLVVPTIRSSRSCGGRRDQAPEARHRICLVIERDPITMAKEVATLRSALERPRAVWHPAAAGTRKRC